MGMISIFQFLFISIIRDNHKRITYIIGSSSSSQEKTNDARKHNSTANLRPNSTAYNRNTATNRCVFEYNYLHNQVNNPLASRVPYKPSNDLSKTTTNKPNNGLPKSTTYNTSNDLSKTVSNKSNTGLPNSVTNKPGNISSKSVINNLSDTVVNIDAKIYNDCERKICKNCNSYHTFTELGKLSTCCNILSKVDCKDIIGVQSNFVKDISFTKEEYNLKHQKIYTGNKEPTNVPAVLPLRILTKDDFVLMWFSWKNEFLTYIKLIDQAGNNKKKWGIMLLNRLGPVGQEICKTFTFGDGEANDDINVLLKKFDHYCTFGGQKRTHNEDIDTYVNNLKVYLI